MRYVYGLTAALLLGSAAYAVTAPVVAQVSPATATPADTASAIVPRAGAPASFADLTAQLQPAVVNISTMQRVDNPYAGTPYERIAPSRQRGQSLGSGFVISADGYIVTNNHVVSPGAQGAVVESITVTMPDRKEYTARLVGRDPESDLAVLKINASNLHFVRFGDSRGSRVGDWVLAIGNPFGLGGTVTSGIVSAVARNTGIGGAYDRYIQTDASINRGNSGGPMFNMSGQVIGINSAIFSPTGGSVGIGFAIPSEVAQPIVDRLMKGQTISRGYLGVEIAQLDDDMASAMGLAKNSGEFVQRVIADGAADKAGLQGGDVVLKVNNQHVTPDNTLSYIVANTAPGTRIPLEIVRNGRPMTLTATVAQRPSAEEIIGQRFDPDADQSDDQAQSAPNRLQGDIASLGLQVQPLTADIARQIGVDTTTRGVVIANVALSSDAKAKGLQRGDVILSANRQAVTTNAELTAAVTQAKREGRTAILLQVLRRGIRPIFVPVRLDN